MNAKIVTHRLTVRLAYLGVKFSANHMYNLLMTAAAGSWNSPTYAFPTARFLEHTAAPIEDRFKKFSPEVVAELMNMPALFAYESFVNEPARVGRITNLQHRFNSLHVTLALDPQIPPIQPGKLEELALDLDINAAAWEFGRTHWAIKDVDLAGVLVAKGIVASAPLAPQPSPPKVFITYSWDSAEHRQWVAELGTWLRSRGIDVILDQWHVRPGEDLGAFMERSIREADRVLVICTEAYVEKARNRMGGVGYEHTMVTGALMQNLGTSKFIPVVRQSTAPPVLPAELSTRYRFDLGDGPHRVTEFENLARELHGIRVQIPPLGVNPYLNVV